MKQYRGIIPPCGVFCGGCPRYDRLKKPCLGAEEGCRKCKTFYECCITKKGLQFCFQCKTFPCYRFKKFAESWKQYGQDLIANQERLKVIGEKKFLEEWNHQCVG